MHSELHIWKYLDVTLLLALAMSSLTEYNVKKNKIFGWNKNSSYIFSAKVFIFLLFFCL